MNLECHLTRGTGNLGEHHSWFDEVSNLTQTPLLSGREGSESIERFQWLECFNAHAMNPNNSCMISSHAVAVFHAKSVAGPSSDPVQFSEISVVSIRLSLHMEHDIGVTETSQWTEHRQTAAI